MSDRSLPLPLKAKAGLLLQILATWVRVEVGLRRRPLPDVVAGLRSPERSSLALQPRRLSRAVDRVMKVGTYQPRCIIRSLVLFRLLKDQGTNPDLVIGLPDDATDHLAHAWIEIDGVDVGPRPGRAGHQEMARYR